MNLHGLFFWEGNKKLESIFHADIRKRDSINQLLPFYTQQQDTVKK